MPQGIRVFPSMRGTSTEFPAPVFDLVSLGSWAFEETPEEGDLPMFGRVLFCLDNFFF